MKKTLLLFSALATSSLFAQNDPIQADRPDQTETPAIVPKGMFQVETGFTYQKNEENSTSNSLPSVLWKYGVNENFELRLITEYVSEKNFDEKSDGFTPILIGFKVGLCEEKGIIPKTSFIGHIALPNAASSRYKNDFVAPEFRFTMQHTLSDKFSLGYNLGCEWDGVTPETIFVYTLTTGYSINKKLGCYAEIFGFAPEKDKANHNADAGFTYLINNNFMVDLSSGVGITENAPDYYLALGCSFRI
ncbi:transporter [Flavobacterium wongokense]|uniref:transporter n=1 Tax=Flavobacterium wongokense TaxID=2910674 RepID=UPI001F15FF38|nr:transporter [Flavobacterium sp. WG47]MCF6131562.1 transporter [Flavobacterium sp. WG47]